MRVFVCVGMAAGSAQLGGALDCGNPGALRTAALTAAHRNPPRPQYIALLRKCRLRERLRAAREAMYALFPFNERQWAEWLGDEAAAARGAADVERLRGLHQRAVTDYLSVELWAGYLE
jgi:hypothetical protein